MKQLGGAWKVVLAGGVAAFAVGLLASAQAGQATAKVQSIKGGTAQYSTDGSTWAAAQVGTALQQGSTVKTDAAGVADLYLGKNGPYIRLEPDTTLSFTTLMCEQGAGEMVTSTEVSLTSGNAVFAVRKQGAGSRYTIKTASATANVLGTKVNAFSRGQFSFKDGSGEVFYTAPGATSPTKFNVPTGYTFEPTANNNKGGVIPTMAELTQQMDETPFGVRVAGAVYAPTPTWEQLQSSFQMPGTVPSQFTLPPLSNPTTPVSSPVVGPE